MALQDSNLLLLETDVAQADYGLPRTLSATDSIGLPGDLIVGGDLTVDGDIVSVGTRDVVVTDNFIDLNNGNTASARSGGLTVNVQATTTQSMSGVVVTFTAAAGATDATVAIAGYDPSLDGNLNVNDIVEISGLSDLGENNGLFVVSAIGTGAGQPISLKRSGTVGASAPFCQTQVEAGTETGPATAVLGTSLDLGVITISDGTLPADATNTTQIAKGSFATAYMSNATDQLGAGTLIYGDAATVSLQEAYDEGATIDMSTLRNLDITTNETAANESNFRILKQGGGQYLATDAANDMINLGAVGANTAHIGMIGDVNSDIRFLATGNQLFRIGNDSAGSGSTDSLELLAAKQGQWIQDQTGVGAGIKLNAAGDGDIASLEAGAYTPGASIAGTADVVHVSSGGTSTSDTIVFATAGAANVAAVIAGATVGGSLTALITLQESAAGNLEIVSQDGGLVELNVSDASGSAGLLVSLGYSGPKQSAFGVASVQMEGPDVAMAGSAGAAVYALSEDLFLASFGTGKKVEITAGSGSVEVDALTVQIDGAASAGGGINVGTITASPIDIDATTLSMDTSLGMTLSSNSAGGGSITIGANVNTGVGIALDPAGWDGSTGALDSKLTFNGFFEQMVGQSSGVGLTIQNGSGAASAQGLIVGLKNNGGTPEVATLHAGLAGARNIMGVMAKTGDANGDPTPVHTGVGFITVLAFDAAPAAANIGDPVYLASGAANQGKVTLTAPIASGDHVVRLGYLLDDVSLECVWAPQFIAKRP